MRGLGKRRCRKGGVEDWATHQSFGLLDMLVAEKELTVKVTQVDRIEIDDVNLAEAS